MEFVQQIFLQCQQIMTEVSSAWNLRYSPLVVTILTTQVKLLQCSTVRKEKYRQITIFSKFLQENKPFY